VTVAVAKDLVLIRGLRSLIISSALGGPDNGALRRNIKENSRFTVSRANKYCRMLSVFVIIVQSISRRVPGQRGPAPFLNVPYMSQIKKRSRNRRL